MAVSPELIAHLQKQYGGASIFRPSAADRWTSCLGSTQRAAPFIRENRSSPDARLGTAAHLIASEALKAGPQPDEMLDRAVKLNDGGPDIFVDEEMVDAVELYINDVWDRAQGPRTKLLVEYRLTLSPADVNDPLMKLNAGTADAVVLNYDDGILDIVDLKYGKGVPVRGDSPQLIDYAALAIVCFPHPAGPSGWRQVRTTVVQPRLPNEDDRIKTVIHTPASLWEFIGKIYGSMVMSLAPNPPLTPDPSGGKLGGYCYWCPAKGGCPALAEFVMRLATQAFGSVPLEGPPSQALAHTPEIIPPKEINLPNPNAVTDVNILASWLDIFPAIETFMSGARQRATALLRVGTQIPNWTLTQRTGHRKYADPAKVPVALRSLGVKTADMYTDPKLLSPAQMEKKLPKEARIYLQDAKYGLVTRPLGDVVLVPTDTNRAGVKPIFDALPDEG